MEYELDEIYSLFKMAGLTKNDFIIYKTVKNTEPSNITNIVKLTKIAKTTCYDRIDRLLKMGVLSTFENKNVRFFVTEDLKILLDNVRLHHISNFKKLTKAKEIVKFSKLNKNVSTKVKHFKNRAELIDAYNDTLFSSENIRAYANIEEMHNALPEFFPDYYNRRSDLGIFINTISPNNEVSKVRHLNDSIESRDMRFINVENYNFSPEVNIYDNKLLLVSWLENMAIIIESDKVSNPLKKIFDKIFMQLPQTSEDEGFDVGEG